VTCAHRLVYLGMAGLGGVQMRVMSVRREQRNLLDRVPSFDDFIGMRRFPALDGLRGVAALMVITYHFGGHEYSWLSGWTGIQIFFVLSGFLITSLALREESAKGRISIRNFWIRRIFRILPAYLAVLLAMIFTTYHRAGSDWILLRDALPHYWTFTNEFANPDAPWMLSWTLGIEQKFYLLWPVIAFSFVLVARARLMIIGLLGGALTVAAVAWAQTPASPASYVSILVGCGLAVLMHTTSGFSALKPLMTPVGRTIIFIAFLVAQLLVARSYALVGELATVGYVVVVAALLPGLVTNGLAASALSTKPLRWAGARSYSLYLCQVLAAWIVYALLPNLSPTAMVIATMAVGLMVADLVYRSVESPMIKLGRHLEHKTRTPATRTQQWTLDFESVDTHRDMAVAPGSAEHSQGRLVKHSGITNQEAHQLTPTNAQRPDHQ
jgi:peptidoglycan/LPS O-acetylase OafA/YrhL